ncbi:hypothetical protein [Breoghania sp.]|uniref:DUF6916 family protein n=1 Tax=Breoghania sp. TaxID=2065378 RepID=UPI002AAACB40|nr:hypothetical protein [Breoghania sp.]
MTDLAALELRVFEPLIGETFRLSCDVGDMDLVLHEAQALGPSIRSRGAFALVFRAAPERPLSQQLYTIHHPALGNIQLLLIPIGPQGDALAYEAIST